MNVQSPFTTQNPFNVLNDLDDGESNDSGKPEPLRSSPNDNGRPKPLQSSSNDNGRPKPLQSSSNDNGRPKPLQSSSNDNGRPKPLQSSSNNNGRPKPLRSSPNDNGKPKPLQTSTASVKSPKRSRNKGFRSQHGTTPDSPSRTPPISGQTRQKWPKNNKTRNTGRTKHKPPGVEKFKSEMGGCFTQLCEKCFDSSPPIMCTESAIGPHCNMPQKHPWEPNKVLVHILNMKDGKIRYLKIRQLPWKNYSLRLCQVMDKQSGCIQGNSCRSAHNEMELKVWKYQVEHRINRYKIAQFCCKTSGRNSALSELLQNLQHADTDGDRRMVSYYESRQSWCYVQPRPPWLYLETTAVLCKDGDECRQGDSCTRPHCLEDSQLWDYMGRNHLRTLDDVLAAIQSPSPSSSSSPQPLVSQDVFQILPSYCQYCHEQFPCLENLHQHVQTLEHRSSVNSDKEKDWRYREPPLNVVNGGFELCKVMQEGGTCFLGESSCTDAHSPKELAEWKRRWEYRYMKRRMAKEQDLYALSEHDLLEMQKAGQGVGTTVEANKGEIQSANQKLNPKATPFKASKKATNRSPKLDDLQEFPPLSVSFTTVSGPEDDDDSLCSDDYIFLEMKRQVEEDKRRESVEKITEESTAKITIQGKPVERDVVQLQGDKNGSRQGDGLESIAKVTVQKEPVEGDVVQPQGDKDGGRQGDALESIAKVTIQKKPVEGDVVQLQGNTGGGHHGQGDDGLESIAKVTVQKEPVEGDVVQLQGDKDGGRQGDGLESIAKVTVQKKPVEGDLVQLQGDKDGGCQGNGLESIAKVTIQKKPVEGDVVQLQGDKNGGRQGDGLESIAKVTIQKKPVEGDVVQLQGDKDGGCQGNGLESIAKVTIQKKPVDGDVVQLQGDKNGGRQGDGLESIAKVTIQKKPVEGDVVQLQGDKDGGRQGDGLESIAKVTVQKKPVEGDVVQLQGDTGGGHHGQGDDGLESIVKVINQKEPFNMEAVQHQERGNMDGRQSGGDNQAESIAKVNIQNRDVGEEVAQPQGGGAGENDEPESIAKVDAQEMAGETKSIHEELPEIKMMPKSSKKQKIQMQKKNNAYVLLNFQYDRSHLEGAGDCDEEDVAEEQENGLEMLSAKKRQEGLSLVSSNPEIYKRCWFHFETSGFIFAIPVGECSSEQIWICGKKRKGQALDMDEVVVEILDNSETCEDENVTAESNQKKIYGKVICILKRSTNPYSRKIVCTLDKFSDNLLVPIDRTFPKIVVFSRANKWKCSRKTDDIVQVTVFKGKNHLGSIRKRHQFDRYAYVHRKDRLNNLFVVEYAHWHSGHQFPMGHIVEELSPGDNKEDGLHILKLTHGIREDLKPQIHEEIERKFPLDWTIPESEIHKRKDLRGNFIFTVDNPETQDLDDALSIDKEEDGTYRVGVHIADVPHFVEENSAVDREARERGVSFYPASAEPVHMLPSRLVDLCSLQPGKDRLAMSFFFTIQQDGCISAVDMERSVIRSQKRLTYEEAEKMITTQQEGSEEAEKVFQLGQLTWLVRRIRLGEDGCHVFSHDSQKEELQHPLASSMVEEMMLITNGEMTNRLMDTYPKLTPLRRQLPPSPEKLDVWQSKHQHDIPNSLFLKSKALSRGTGPTATPNNVHIMKDKWQKLESMADSHAPNKFMQMADIVSSDQNHPQLAVAQRELFHLQERAVYICSGDQQESKKRRHHSLDKTCYTTFTSPIRRHIDIINLRLLVCLLQKKTAQTSGNNCAPSDPPYSIEEMSMICHHSTVQSVRAKRFEKETEALMFALKLKEVPESIPAYVASIDGANLELLFPHRSFISKTVYMFPLSHLKPHTKQDKTDDKISLTWKMRVYDVNGLPEKVHSVAKPVMKKLDSEHWVVGIKAATWQSFHEKIKENDQSGFQKICRKERKHQRQRESDKRSKSQIDKKSTLPVTEATSEMVDSKGNHAIFADFSRDFKTGDVLQFTLSAAPFKGVMSPRIQLVSLTPKLNICTEHRAEPLQSFKVLAQNSLVEFKDIKKYKATWLPIIEMVGVHSAVHEDETMFILNVEIKWSQEGITEVRYEGVFNIPTSFCKERRIVFSSRHVKSDEKEESDEEEANDESYLDYLCIQYDSRQSLGELDSEPGDERQLIPNSDSPGQIKAVLHAAVIDVTQYKSDTTVHFVVKGSSSPFPEVLLSSSKKFPCTVEVIPKAETDRRLEDAVRMVDKASPMIEKIALGHQPVSEPSEMTLKIPKLTLQRIINGATMKPFQLNESQKRAVTMAAKQSFTTIQGPPGTGKTIVGARIAKLYTDVNKNLHESGMCSKRQQVLYCGPSNESVNVITNYLRESGNVKLVRVYSSMIEDQQHPIPNAAVRKDRTLRDNVVTAKLKPISLHDLIRQPSNSHSEKIREFDELFITRDYRASGEEVKAYKKLVSAAKEEELPKYDVILCTCSHSGCAVIAGKVNIAQCIIDEAGMCSQPETLIPLVFNKPRQVVLIGDHKQLRPIITETTAQQLGMETSLLELYQEDATMLTTQYRMHESICQFPSQNFYKSALETANSVKQRRTEHQKLLRKFPGGEHFRAVFCNVIGYEETLACKAAEGNEMSKANPVEVKHAVRIAKSLLNHGVKPENIIIMSQYRLQCANIREELTSGGQDLKKIKVTTVITSQGREWDYVILSLVRSLPKLEIEEKPTRGWMHHNLGFIMDENQMNVALTRAKKGLMIIGNQYLLQVHDKRQSLLSMYRDKSAIVHARSFLRS